MQACQETDERVPLSGDLMNAIGLVPRKKCEEVSETETRPNVVKPTKPSESNWWQPEVSTRYKSREFGFPKYLSKMINLRNKSRSEYHKTFDTEKKFEYEALDGAVKLELGHRRRSTYLMWKFPTNENSEKLEEFITKLVGQNDRNRMCYKTTLSKYHQVRYKGERSAIRHLLKLHTEKKKY
ncbi:hypothetical protein JTB14_014353 [Gonioctena quinquepunctata]|nr:hypothetical protein JTB14_014353 [Gonioctena quinquepunctata]